MSASVKVGSAWKNIVGISVKVGGAWKGVVAAYTKVSGVWKQVYSTLQAYLADWVVNGDTGRPYFQMRADGYAYYSENGGSSYTQAFQWKTGSGAAGDYTVEATLGGGDPINGSYGFLTLDTTLTWNVVGPSPKAGDILLSIVETANHANVLAGPKTVYFTW